MLTRHPLTLNDPVYSFTGPMLGIEQQSALRDLKPQRGERERERERDRERE